MKMKNKLEKLIKMNRKRGWKQPDLIEELGTAPATFYRILNRSNKPEYVDYWEDTMEIDDSLALEEKIDELLNN